MQREDEETRSSTLEILRAALEHNTQVLIYLRNQKKLLGKVRTFDHQFNMILENVKEIWTEKSSVDGNDQEYKYVNMERFISRMLLTGNSVALVVNGPLSEE